jgi:hypothetical protein
MHQSGVKILKLLTSLEMGGTEQQVVHLLNSLGRSIFELNVACFRKKGASLQCVEASGLPVIGFPIHSLYKPETVQQQFRFYRYLKKNRRFQRTWTWMSSWTLKTREDRCKWRHAGSVVRGCSIFGCIMGRIYYNCLQSPSRQNRVHLL